MLRKILRAVWMAPFIWLAATAGAFAEPLTSLKIGLLPGESAPTVLRMNESLRSYLADELGIPVELEVGTSYAATGEALRFGRIDMAYLGPVTYVLQSERVKLSPIARPSRPDAGPQFEAVIIVPADSTASRLRDLAGMTIAFGDPASTSGTWVPQYELLDAGLSAGRDYEAQVLGSHDAVALAVANRKAMAGALSRPIFERLVRQNVLDADAVRVLAYSRSIPEYAFTFRAGVDSDAQRKVADALFAIDAPDILNVFNAERFVPAADEDFEPVRQWVEELSRDRNSQ